MENKTLIILGMHRSGTSLITNWLHNCGLEVGERLLGPGIGNVEGHFEDVEFFRMHEEILKDNNLTDSGLTDGAIEHISCYQKEKIKTIISIKNQLFEEWGWKDPRTCLFLDLYKEVLPDANYLVILRDFQSVIISLLKRKFAEFDLWYDTKKGYLSKMNWRIVKRNHEFEKFCRQNAEFFLKVWIFYNERILECIKNLSPEKYIVLNYNMLKVKDGEVINYLNDHWHFSLHYSEFSNVFKPNLFSKPFDVAHYIHDRTLIDKAIELEHNLECYIKN
jgi:hypothetical protein